MSRRTLGTIKKPSTTGGGAWTLIGTQDASSSASLTQTGLDDSIYDTYAIVLADLVPATDNVEPYIRVGDSGGIDSAGSDYAWGASSMSLNTTTGTEGYFEDNADSQIKLTGTNAVGSAAGEGYGGVFYLHRPSGGNMQPCISGLYFNFNGSAVPLSGFSTGARLSVITLDRIQFFFSSGNIATGRLTVYGISHT
ncbi:MAG TPA: hypothetical protein ENH62_11815 [Marinobacter sp.]|uniref:Uncharacterized protein n=1 Tax=marine sediment metagenome TaxID=412755 RepID=A0A0F9LHW4_9ZZZZ|nr:hypothetical protein [Marinobacter sp.]